MELYPIILKNSKAELRFEQHSLPAPPLTFTSSLNIKKINYPGNPEPTVQVLNERFTEIEFNGRFRDLSAKEEGYAERRRNELQDFKAMAEETVFQYASQVFIGMIEEVTFSTHNIREIEYKIKFNIFSMKFSNTPKILNKGIPDIKAVKEKAGILKETLSNIKNISDKISDIHNQIQTKINNFKDESGLNDYNEIVATGNTILINIKNLNSYIRSINTSTFIDTINMNAFQHNLTDLRQEVTKMVSTAQTQTSDSTLSSAKTIIHIVGREETLYTISNKYYKDQTLWYKIAIQNQLKVMELELGQKLVIPL